MLTEKARSVSVFQCLRVYQGMSTKDVDAIQLSRDLRAPHIPRQGSSEVVISVKQDFVMACHGKQNSTQHNQHNQGRENEDVGFAWPWSDIYKFCKDMFIPYAKICATGWEKQGE